MQKTILVDIAPDGSTQIETRGFVGTECLKETADLERKLGAKISDAPTPEAFKAPMASANKQTAGR